MSLFDEIPGYRAALSAETEQRDAAFLDVPQIISRRWPDRPFVRYLPRKPLAVQPLTIRRMLLLEHANSPFICGAEKEISAGDIALFLWVCSADFSADKKRRDKFIRGCRTLKAGEALETIWRSVRAAFYDSPPSSGSGESASYWSLAASIVDTLASEYGWTRSEILDAPLSQVLQLFKIINHRAAAKAGERVPMFNPSDRVKARWLETVNAGKAANG